VTGIQSRGVSLRRCNFAINRAGVSALLGVFYVSSLSSANVVLPSTVVPVAFLFPEIVNARKDAVDPPPLASSETIIYDALARHGCSDMAMHQPRENPDSDTLASRFMATIVVSARSALSSWMTFVGALVGRSAPTSPTMPVDFWI